MYENEDFDGIHWSQDVIFQYVPDIFETATVTKSLAIRALEESITLNFFRLIPA